MLNNIIVKETNEHEEPDNHIVKPLKGSYHLLLLLLHLHLHLLLHHHHLFTDFQILQEEGEV